MIEFIIHFLCTMTEPRRIICPKGWIANYATREGTVECALANKGDDAPKIAYHAQIYCRTDEIPVVSGRVANCKRFHIIDGNLFTNQGIK